MISDKHNTYTQLRRTDIQTRPMDADGKTYGLHRRTDGQTDKQTEQTDTNMLEADRQTDR